MGISPEHIIYPPFTKDVRGGAFGCFDSHVKIWHDFYLYFPNESYALIFEDDFIAPPEGMLMIKNAEEFISKNEDVDILHLQHLCIPVSDKLNNQTFTKGYGLGTHAYFVTRKYIQSILNKHGKFPEANGRHIDYEMSINIKSRDNMIYTEKIFYTVKEGFKQQIGVSDNKLNSVDKLIDSKKSDRSEGMRMNVEILIFLKKYTGMTDIHIKKLCCLIYPIVCCS